MSNEQLGLSGQVHMVLKDRYGFIKDERDGPNLVVTDGKEEVARLIGGDAGAAFTHIAIGIDNTTAGADQTALVSESTSEGAERATADVSIITQTVTNDSAQFVTTFSFTDAFSVVESGVFNDSAAGDMLCRQIFTALAVDDGDSLTVTWKIRAG